MLNPKSEIDSKIRQFNADAETALTESTLNTLLTTYPNNEKVQDVLLKVITINTLYHARVLDIDLQLIAAHLARSKLDTRLNQGDPTVVSTIYECPGARHHYFSFATKYCSWHNPEAYSIYDGNVWQTLAAYRKQGMFAFKTSEWSTYEGFLAVVKRFRSSFQLDNHSLKPIDKFLWWVGYELQQSLPELEKTAEPSPIPDHSTPLNSKV